MKDLLTYIVKGLVDNPDDVMILEVERDADNLLLEVHVAPTDMGKVIGKQGRIAKAIRTVIKAAATTQKKKVTVDIVDD